MTGAGGDAGAADAALGQARVLGVAAPLGRRTVCLPVGGEALAVAPASSSTILAVSSWILALLSVRRILSAACRAARALRLVFPDLVIPCAAFNAAR